MKLAGFAATILLGACIGGGATWAWMVFGTGAYPSVSPWELRAEDDHRDYSYARSMPRSQLAGRLLARVGQTFVDDARYGKGSIEGVWFYPQPTPYGESLCEVHQINVPRKIVRGRAENQRELAEDDISFTTMYGVWKVPGVSPSLTRETACAHYRDFGHLIFARETLDVFALAREVNILTAAVAKVKSGKVDFKLICRDARDSDHPKACDGAALLARVDFRNVSQVDHVEEESSKSDSSERHVDRVYMRHGWISGCGKNEVTVIKVVSTQVYGQHADWEGNVQEIDIVRSTIC